MSFRMALFSIVVTVLVTESVVCSLKFITKLSLPDSFLLIGELEQEVNKVSSELRNKKTSINFIKLR